MAFQYSAPTSPYASTIAELLAHQNDPQARAAEVIAQARATAAQQSGQAWAGAAQNIGQSVAGAINQATDPKRKIESLQASELQKNIAEGDTLKGVIRKTPLIDLGGGVMGYDLPALTKTVADSGGDPAALIAHVQPVNDALQQFHAGRMTVVQNGARALQAAGNDPELADGFLTLLEKNGVATPDQLKQFRAFATTPENVAKLTGMFAGPSKFGTAAPGASVVNESTGQLVPGQSVPPTPISGRPGTQLQNPLTGAPIGSPVPALPSVAGFAAAATDPTKSPDEQAQAQAALDAAKPPPAQKNVQSESFLLDGKPVKGVFDPVSGTYRYNGEDVTARVKPLPTAAAVTLQQGNSDVKDTVAGMMDGSIPPQLPGRASKEYVALMAEAHRQGYDLASAASDWTATQKHLATLNGAQQTRLRQAISTASDSLGVIEDLAKQWDGGKFPVLNKAMLATAKNGLLGPKAQQIATNLDAQITDVTSELGNVYMGGNSPTDHALGLAQKNLSAEWTKDQLLSAVQLARTNLQIRTNSIANTGAMLGSGAAATPATTQPIKVGGFTVIVK